MLLNDMHTDWKACDNDTRPAIVTLNTNGHGYWTSNVKPVQVTELTVPYISEDGDFGELCVHFNTDSWRPDRDGLIYTDTGFIAALQTYLIRCGYAGDDVEYSEQGMQGDNYVSCDVGKLFLDSWNAKHPDKYAAALN